MLFGITWNIIGDGLSDAFHPDSGKRRFVLADIQVEPVAADSIHYLHPRSPVGRPVPSPRPETQISVRNSIILQTARNAVINKNLPKALEAYGFLIKRSRLLDVVIKDLTALVRLFSTEPQLWKMLGDALTRSGNQDFANKAYAQAELVARKHGQG